MSIKSIIGVYDLETKKIIKSFDVRVMDNGKSAKIKINFKSKGEEKSLVKSYLSLPARPALIGCIQAVCKYWPKFDPTKHRPAVLCEAEKALLKKKKSKGSK